MQVRMQVTLTTTTNPKTDLAEQGGLSPHLVGRGAAREQRRRQVSAPGARSVVQQRRRRLVNYAPAGLVCKAAGGPAGVCKVGRPHGAPLREPGNSRCYVLALPLPLNPETALTRVDGKPGVEARQHLGQRLRDERLDGQLLLRSAHGGRVVGDGDAKHVLVVPAPRSRG